MTKTDEHIAQTEAEHTATDLAQLPANGATLAASLGIRFADPQDVQWEIAERLALAQTPEELFGDNGPLGLRAHLGRPFKVRQVRYLRGRYEGGPGFYALISAVDEDTGEALVFTSGAMNVLIQLARAEQMGWLDRSFVARQSDTPTADGYYPYRLVLS